MAPETFRKMRMGFWVDFISRSLDNPSCNHMDMVVQHQNVPSKQILDAHILTACCIQKCTRNVQSACSSFPRQEVSFDQMHCRS